MCNLMSPNHARCAKGFTLLEVLIGVVVIGGMTLSLYVGMTQGFAVIQLARENLRATQILQEKTEAIRLLNWTDLNQPGYVPPTFEASFYATGDQVESSGPTYSGQVTITNAPMTESYANDLRLVVVDVTWMSGNVARHRSMRTLVAKYGLQNYVYDPN
jgi:prepilin-type N-terminal cleavage/methylation domain-containing protein